ncbi:hypothetical protein IFR05_009643 [Cadophora sp. M221]|nr:hypothetical protein IFR05_009643 [Cadophora sp. M221]
MPSDQVVQQQIQAPEPMSADSSNIELQQPKPVPAMGDEVGMRGGEEADVEFGKDKKYNEVVGDELILQNAYYTRLMD